MFLISALYIARFVLTLFECLIFLLQNPEDKREILCDAKLKRVLGGNSKVTMFSMNKYITAHLLEKMDKSAYVHVDIDSGKKEEEVSSVGEVEDSDDDSV